MDDRANDAAPLGPFEVLDLGGGAKTGVVEQDIEPPERRLRLGEQGLDRAGIADIGRHTERLDLQGLDLADDGLQRLRSAPGNDDRKAFARQRQRRCLADTTAAAGDQRNLAV